MYPIKVNQQRHVVEEIVEYGAKATVGLEAGSKPELLIALAMLETPGALIICNGYKDRKYIETALLAQRLGRTPIIVVDRFHEVELIIRTAQELGIRPHIGVRARLSTKGAGKWIESTGDRSKFGLTAVEIVEAVDRLRAEGMLDCLELLHFHIGSQITAIRAHKDALREASRIFVGLHEMGAKPRYLDVGGGLGVDYDGSQTNFHSSMNYSVQEYANDVVASIQEACDAQEHPASGHRHRSRARHGGAPLGADLRRARRARDALRQAAGAGRGRRSQGDQGPRRDLAPASRRRTCRRPTTTACS